MQPTAPAAAPGLAARFARPGPALALAGGALMMAACAADSRHGPHAVAFRYHAGQLFSLGALMMAGRRLLAAPPASLWAAARSAAGALPWFLLFCALIGPHGLVSNGLDYEAMAADYWTVDPVPASSRRIGLPALAHLLSLDGRLYAAFWYAALFGAYWAAHRLLVRRGLAPWEALSLATSSLLAYALEGPGYGEVAVLLLAAALLMAPSAPAEKAVAAAFALAVHEVAALFAGAALVLASERDERRDWLFVFGVLAAALALCLAAAAWRNGVGAALLGAAKAQATDELTAADLLWLHPWRALLGALVSYKLYWLALVAALRRPGGRAMAALAAAALALVVAGADTSRLVQFGTPALFLAVSAELQRWSGPARRRLALLNLAVPSAYVAVNAGALWGPGLYSLYMRAGLALGLPFGRVFWH